nr:SDR family NAD(P)-dependent oxidoreductase [uncultured Rhodopila sp.]
MSVPPADPRDVLRRALVEIRALKEKLAAAESGGVARAEPVAVVGIGCRFPGGIASPGDFWRLLSRGEDAIGPRPGGRWAAAAGSAPLEGGFLADIEGFDARFFGISPREAAAMDPQHRLLLEVAWEALEHAAIDPSGLAGSRTGVFAGLATNDFARGVPEPAVDRYFGVGSSPAVASGRLAYLLDLRGPCITLDTACSSSLVAVHYAMRALRDRDCDTALAGGVSLMLGSSLGESFVAAGMLAPDGRCKSFDARADGYGRGEGAGMVVLRRLSDALRDGDPVLAVLRGSAINQDGRSAGLTAPNGPAQTALIRAALDVAGLAPADIDYMEAHGTGTPLGDPIEWHALAAIFADRDRPLLVGSVKTNFGHTEAAAGIAGLIKTVLALQHGAVPPNLHFRRRNPAISAGSTPLEVPISVRGGVRRAGVSAFGFSGTNAHVVLEAAPAREMPAASGEGLLLISAHDPAALRALAGQYRQSFDAGLSFAAACHTAAVGRARLPWWIAVRSPAELAGAVPSDAPAPAAEPTAGPRIVLPTYPFQRERFALPGAAPAERTLLPDDPLLKGTGGLAHLGVLLSLPGTSAESLRDVTFPAPLIVATARQVRVERSSGWVLLQSRTNADTEWSTHLAATPAEATLGPRFAITTTPDQPADGLYARIAAYGFRYDAAAQCLLRIAIDGDMAVGSLTASSTISPGAIEAAAQLAYALLAADAPPVMLAGADRLLRAPGGVPATAWLRRIAVSPDGGLRADFGLCDAAGNTLLRIEGAAFAPLPDNARRWSRVIAWRQAGPPAAAAVAPFVWHAPDGDPASLCAALLDLLPGVGERALRVITRGAQHTGCEAASPALGQAALWGMAQAVIAERPGLRCRLIDLDPDMAIEAQRAFLDAEALAEDEPLVAWRRGQRLVRRLEDPPRPLPAGEVATLPAPGVLRWEPRPAAEPGPGMVRIAVVAAGLTFRDRLLFSGLAPAGSTFGADCAGLVDAVGPGVAGLRAGDRVVALAADAIADTVTVPALSVAPAPRTDMVASASMPVPYLTAVAGLGDLGPDDCVLVHQAGSATGLAALAVARRAGASVIATAARQRHAWFTPEPIERLLDSRDPAGWGGALAGVTVAFGAFDPDLEERLAGIRVVNLDKRAARHFDLDRIDPAVKRDLLHRLAELPPLPRRVVARGDLAAALGGEGPLVGRTVVLLRDPPPAVIERGATYLVTGAGGALGGMVADWLAAAGARLCLVDRVLLPADPRHVAVQADAGDPGAMAALFDRVQAGPSPLRGVFHCAAVTDDDRLELQTADRLAAVVRAKVDGALLLDRLTRSRCTGSAQLDHFVMFSSVAGVLPSARQSGYAAANAVLDQIAQARRQRGLPGLSLDWGPWHAGIGLAMGGRAAEAWQGFGVTPILPAAGLRALPALLASPEPQRVVADMVRETAETEVSSGTPLHADPGPIGVERLQAILAPLLGVRDSATLDPDTPLMSFGLDSLTAVEFARALSRTLGRPVAPDFVYNHPTLARAAAALTHRRTAAPRPIGFVLRAPTWEASTGSRSAEHGWTVAGGGPVAAALRAALPEDPANLVDLAALDIAPSGGMAARDALFAGLLNRLRPLPLASARIVLVVPPEGALAGAVEGFAAALAAERPGWAVRTVRLGLLAAESPAALLRELGVDDREPRVRLSGYGREIQRLTAVSARGAWQPAAGATYLVTGGSGGIGALVAGHLVARGARNLVLAARRPVLPPELAGGPARIRIHAADLGNAGEVAALMADLRRSQPPLKGIFHVAGVTADGTIGEAGWDRLGRGFPAKADAARAMDTLSRDLDLDAFVLFSSTTAWFGLPGTAGYAAANGFLDGLAAERKAAGLSAVSIAWCAWQGVGMASDPALWQGGRVASLAPEMALAALDPAIASGEPCLVVTDPAWHPASACRLLEQNVLAAAGCI